MKLINCPVCGARVSMETEKCPECGFEIKKYLEESAVVETESPSRKWIWFALSVAAVLTVLIALFVFLRADPNHRTEVDTSANDTSEMVPPLSVSTSEQDLSSNVPDESEIAGVGEVESDSPVGVYSGDDHEILVIHNNGYAYYYCITPEYTELECPWSYSDETVSIEFSKMHCVISAKKADENFSELVFRSESVNWNAEVFTKLDLDPDNYINRQVSAYDPAVTINHDGTMTFELSGIHFIIPKQYRDLPDDFDNMENVLAFVDNDASIDYMSTLLFYSRDNDGNIIDEEQAAAFAGWFMDKASAELVEECTLAGRPSYNFNVSGSLNNGFRSLNGYNCSGRLVIVDNGDENLYILMIQSDDRGYDSSEIYDQIILQAE